MSVRATILVIALVPATAYADDDGYCDFVEGTAAADAATLFAPQVFGQFGYVEQPVFAVTPTTDSSNLRALGGVRYSLTNIYAGFATTSRARADCKRHGALVSVRGASAARALAARVRVYDDAQQEADRILSETEADLEARRRTAQEATAMRLRVEELRTLSATARSELAALPPVDQRPLNSTLATFRAADASLEENEAKLRNIRAYDVNVRFGADKFLEGSNTKTQYFAVVELGINLGAFWMGAANDRAAAGRKRFTESGRDPLGADAAAAQMRAMLDLETKRTEQTAALVADLDRQLQDIAKIPGDDSRRFREIVWFDWVKAKADLAYLQAHVAALREVLGSDAR